ncbi:hypothetical protein [Brasilonema bromeliae]|nr:hypothetical protein [Brasilonema bromeliae]
MVESYQDYPTITKKIGKIMPGKELGNVINGDAPNGCNPKGA